MSNLIKNKKLLIFGSIVLILPVALLLFNTMIDIIFNLGVSLGTSARYTMEGVCCK